jgi:hypothetical protein
VSWSGDSASNKPASNKKGAAELLHSAEESLKRISEGVGEMVEGLSLPADRRSEIRFTRLSSSPSRRVVAIVKLTPPSRRRPL